MRRSQAKEETVALVEKAVGAMGDATRDRATGRDVS